MRRLLGVALAGLVLAAVSAPAAVAERPSSLPHVLNTTHFKIHYDTILHQQAGDLGAHAERAYAALAEWGYPAPLDDGDGQIDIYVMSITGYYGLAFSDTTAPQSSGYIILAPSVVDLPYVVMHELFHLVQFGIWAPAEGWLVEATAEWAGFRFVDFPPTLVDGLGEEFSLEETLGAPDMSLTCVGYPCGTHDYERGGYSRWSFFQYLSERFGGTTVREIFELGKLLNDPTLGGIDLVAGVLATRGATLSDTFTDWTVVNMTGAYAATGLRGIVPPTYSATLTGGTSGQLGSQKVSVNHLATRYLAFARGDGSSGTCYAATLTLTVSLPVGVGSRPSFHWTGSETATPLAISGGNATLSIPWDTCSWSHVGLLSLPNPTTTIDAAVFTVSGSITVDRSRIVTSTSPPPTKVKGDVTAAPTTDGPPSFALYGPEVLSVSRKTRTVRLVVFSSGSGALQVSLGSSRLTTRNLRAGNNDLRFKLPLSAMRTLASRSTKAAARTLTLTSLSPSGARGATITKRLTVRK